MIAKPERLVDEALLARVRGLPCAICRARGVDAHHVRSRGAAGPDVDWNVAPLCRNHHQMFHQLGLRTFVIIFPAFGLWLRGRGWTDEGGRWGHPQLIDEVQ